MKNLSRCIALLLTVILSGLIVSGTAEGIKKYQIEENPEVSRINYPYKVTLDSAILYLAQEDIDLLGEEAFYAGLYLLLENMEDDFAEAREYLKDYLKDEIPPVRVCTCFSDSYQSQIYSAYYYNADVGIRLYGGWEYAAASLLHEYVHYLTLDNMRYAVKGDFWIEGIAEYVAFLACSNKMARSVNYGLNSYTADLESDGVLDKDGIIDIHKYFYRIAASWDTAPYTGEKYTAVSGKQMTMTKRIQEHPVMDLLTYKQAACFLEYLVNRFGKEKVFTHMTYESKNFRGLYGRTFEELCNEWKQENIKRCTELGVNPEP